MPYTQEQLKEAFDLLADPADWRAPIAVFLPGEHVNLAVEAIKHFTATVPTVMLDLTRMKYLIRSEGYRAGPAGDQ